MRIRGNDGIKIFLFIASLHTWNLKGMPCTQDILDSLRRILRYLIITSQVPDTVPDNNEK